MIGDGSEQWRCEFAEYMPPGMGGHLQLCGDPATVKCWSCKTKSCADHSTMCCADARIRYRTTGDDR